MPSHCSICILLGAREHGGGGGGGGGNNEGSAGKRHSMGRHEPGCEMENTTTRMGKHIELSRKWPNL